MGISRVHRPRIRLLHFDHLDGNLWVSIPQEHQHYRGFGRRMYRRRRDRLYRQQQHQDRPRHYFPLVRFPTKSYKLGSTKPVRRVHTFRIRVYAPAILPMLAVYGRDFHTQIYRLRPERGVKVSLAMEAIGDITASAEVSQLSVNDEEFDTRIQGGILVSTSSPIPRYLH